MGDLTTLEAVSKVTERKPPWYNSVGLVNHTACATEVSKMDDQSLAHSRYNCTYHIVFIPKYRRKAMFGALRRGVGEILGKVCRMEEVTIIKAATMPDHVHMYVSIPLKVSISKTIGRIKGKSALMIFDRHPEYREKYNRHFWTRGYYCETIGKVNEETIVKYIADQYERGRMEGER